MGQVTYKFNILTVAVIVLAIFACGYFAHQSIVKNKEIRAIEKQVQKHKDKADEYTNIILLKSDTITELKKVIQKTNIAINAYNVKISHLNAKLEGLMQSNAQVPVSVKYDVLVERVEPDTLSKDYCFSDRQIGWLYQDNQELPIVKDKVIQLESLADALNYNLELSGETVRLTTDQLSTCESKNEEYIKALLLKDDQVKLLKKQRKGRGIYSVIATTVAVVTTGFLFYK
jgi:uncharacterized protein (UPF0333 family)